LSALKVRVRGTGALDVAELGEQPAPVAAVTAVGLAKLRHALELLVDQRIHAALEQLGQRLTRRLTIVLTPLDILGLHGLQHLKSNR
jgi:hypothetical protein